MILSTVCLVVMNSLYLKYLVVSLTPCGGAGRVFNPSNSNFDVYADLSVTAVMIVYICIQIGYIKKL